MERGFQACTSVKQLIDSSACKSHSGLTYNCRSRWIIPAAFLFLRLAIIINQRAIYLTVYKVNK